MTDSVGIELFHLRENAVFTSEAHAQYEKDLKKNIEWGELFSTVTCASLAYPAAITPSWAKLHFKILSVLVPAGLYIANKVMTDYVAARKAELIKVNQATTAWKLHADEMKSFEHRSKGPSYYERSDLDKFIEHRKLLHKDKPKTNNEAYKYARHELNKTWYSGEATRYGGMGEAWTGMARYSRKLAEQQVL